MNRYALRTGEMLAISGDAIRRDADGFFLLLGGEPPENETRGTVTIVNIRGALQQYRGPGGDSYEAITARVTQAFAADPKPSAVILRISSPGGVVAGLNECVLKLQRMSKAAKVPLVAYADELAASAAYAMCCACSEILAPPSGIVGSVGVISTMVSIAKRDEKDGIEFRIITSGKRKADGHVHVPITDDAERAEQARNAQMATQFFALAGKARRIAPTKLQALQAAIYMGKDAKRVGLVDDVLGLDDVLLGLDASEIPSYEAVAPNEGNVTDRRAKKVLDSARTGTTHSDTRSGGTATNGEAPMSVKLSALIKKTEAAISTESDPTKLRAHQARLAAFMATKAEMDDDDGDGGDHDDDSDDESASKKAAEAARKAKAKAESAKHRAKAAEHKSKAAEYEEAAKKCEEEAASGEEDEEDEEEEARLRTPTPHALTPGQAAALASQGDIANEALSRVAKLEKQAEATAKASLIESALNARRITRPEAKTLSGKAMAFVKDFLEMRPKSLIATSDNDLIVPSTDARGDSLPREIDAAIDQAMSVYADKTPAERDKIRSHMVEAHKRRMNGAPNGARY